MNEIKQTITNIARRALLFLVLGVIGLGGVTLYQFYQKQTADWQTATLHFYGDKSSYTGEFAFEKGEIVQENRCQRTQHYKSGNLHKTRCIGEYKVYVSRDGVEFEVGEVRKPKFESSSF